MSCLFCAAMTAADREGGNDADAHYSDCPVEALETERRSHALRADVLRAAEEALATRTTEFTQLSDSFVALQNEHAADAKLAAVVREHGDTIRHALADAWTRATHKQRMFITAASKALAEALKT